MATSAVLMAQYGRRLNCSIVPDYITTYAKLISLGGSRFVPEPPLFILSFLTMDHKFTKQIQAWLNSEHESDENIIEGADMLFRLNRDRFYHARAIRQPKAYRSNIEYELNKFLKIRLDGMTIDEVKQMNALVIPEAQAIINEGAPVATTESTTSKNTDEIGKNGDDADAGDAELPSSESDGVAVIRKGKRKDHEFLPDKVAALWDINAKRYKEIKSTFETLKTMEDKEPCDRYEYLKILSDLDKSYRADMQTYDSYVVTTADRERVAKAKLAEHDDQA